ncbi:uncharacterized protein METZ01_LOCUS312576, partial [marine metagenome]
VPQTNGTAAFVYVRVEVEDREGERLFLQPVRFEG